jgi:hypothetical protein
MASKEELKSRTNYCCKIEEIILENRTAAARLKGVML